MTSADRILDAAERCLAAVGVRRMSMNDVATAAGVSRATVYNHFTDREALIQAVTVRLARAFVASSEPEVARRRTLAAQVGEAAVFIVTHSGGSDDELLATILSAHSTHLVEAWVEFWDPYLAAAEERGEVRPKLDRRRAGEWIVRLLLSFAVMPSASVDLTDPAAIRQFVRDHLVRGLT
jgi:AcrR family transcriptional regulator